MMSRSKATMAKIDEVLELVDVHKNVGVALFYDSWDEEASSDARYLIEGGQDISLNKRWHVRYDPGLQPGQEDHLHVMHNKKQVCVINKSGTPSHNTTINLPKKIRRKIKELGLVFMEGAVVLAESEGEKFFDLAVDALISIFEEKKGR